jgi:uncharacterized damage-inducible protein DinB
MMTAMEWMCNEIQREAQTTLRLLERIPADRMAWKPHVKSMSLGQLALHVAAIPGALCSMAQADVFDAASVNFEPPAPESAGQILVALEQSIDAAVRYLSNLDAGQAEAPWRLTLHGKEVLTMPRLGLLRSFLFNHWYHHRGQLTVYLRLLDVPLPVVYGRTADENPFA